MKKFLTFSALAIAALLAGNVPTVDAGGWHYGYCARCRADRVALYYAGAQPWHGEYYHTNYGVPIALVVPPTANSQVDWGWGVTQSESRPIYHQFLRPYPGDFAGGEMGFLPTPQWPSHTRQFGVYSVRGPW
jgi:hypothetical protein